MSSEAPAVVCVMPTRDRHVFASRAVDLFRRQTYPNKALMVVTDGAPLDIPNPVFPGGFIFQNPRPPTRDGIGSLVDNIRYAIKLLTMGGYFGATHVAFWEDDDWYHPERLAFQMSQVGDAPAHGYPFTNYYHIGTSMRWEGPHPERASNNGTLVRRDWLIKNGYPDTRYPDVDLWKSIRGGVLSGNPHKPHCIGIKHNHGGLGAGHRGMCTTPDAGWGWLSSKIDDESLEFYRSLGHAAED